MQIFTGKLLFINQAPAGKKADSIVVKLMDGTDQRFYMTKGESKSLLQHKGAIVTVTVPKEGKPAEDGKVFLWTSKDNINIASEATPTVTEGSKGGGSVTSFKGRQFSEEEGTRISYQALAKVAVEAAVHNASLKKKEVTAKDIHDLTLGLLGFLFDKGLTKTVKNLGAQDDDENDILAEATKGDE